MKKQICLLIKRLKLKRLGKSCIYFYFLFSYQYFGLLNNFECVSSKNKTLIYRCNAWIHIFPCFLLIMRDSTLPYERVLYVGIDLHTFISLISENNDVKWHLAVLQVLSYRVSASAVKLNSIMGEMFLRFIISGICKP